ncbi:MAG TPA: PEP-CTERM sorting domain-containing protein [Fimbriimonadaceae bacterium]|nr:PEP-CTERM sorting domain-containing protein [Fimbriimonadaceae bacterium]HRJ32483.1 PEP-CTERM sorting domain-containing protein [Fimbriimonadaceae bacterium]
MNTRNRILIPTLALAGAMLAQQSTAQSISAIYTGEFGTPTVKFTTALPGHNGAREDGTTRFNGTRTDTPGPGVDNTVPALFKSFCVEIGENLPFNQAKTHTQVVNLLGSSTINGGISGPVLFDALRTQRLQTLWGSFYGAITTQNAMRAFQLAQWELCFDNDATLVQGTLSKLWVTPAQNQAGVTNLAENWLTQIRTGQATTQMNLMLLRGNGVQDQVTPGQPVPEPGTMAALGLGLAAIARRRKAKKAA